MEADVPQKSENLEVKNKKPNKSGQRLWLLSLKIILHHSNYFL